MTRDGHDLEATTGVTYCTCGWWTYTPDRDHPATPDQQWQQHLTEEGQQ